MSACTKNVNPKEVSRNWIVGEYEANHYLAKDTLEIRADGTYTRRYQGEGSKEFINTNRWELEEWQGAPLITFEGWHSPSPLGLEIEIMGKNVEVGTRPGRWPARVERSIFGKPRFCIDRDRGYFYLKK